VRGRGHSDGDQSAWVLGSGLAISHFKKIVLVLFGIREKLRKLKGQGLTLDRMKVSFIHKKWILSK
jgi:hypothetical protein